MKKTLSLLFLCASIDLWAQTPVFSQQKTGNKQSSKSDQIGTKEVLTVSPEKQYVAKTKNENSAAIIIDGVTIDKRAASYYKEGDLKGVSVQKAIKINHIYVDSYEIIDGKLLSSHCKEIIEKEFDLGSYNYLRKKDSRVIVPVNFQGCTFTIFLFSWDEIDQLK